MRALFGPAGNPQDFYDAGYKHTYEIFDWLRDYGLDAYEYSAGRGVSGSDKTFEKIGQCAERAGIVLSFHAPYFISLSGEDEEKRLKSLDYIRDSIRASRLMGADRIVIHTGSVGKRKREDALALARDTMQRALELFPDDDVHLGLETMGKVGQLGTLDEVTELCSIDSRLYPVVDFGHLNARDFGGVFTNCDDYMRVFDMIGERLGEDKAKNLHCHFSKIEYTHPGGEKRHLTFEDTIYGPQFEPLGEVIAKNGFTPRIICESAGTQAKDALYMKRCTYGQEN